MRNNLKVLTAVQNVITPSVSRMITYNKLFFFEDVENVILASSLTTCYKHQQYHKTG